jgi:glycosyltransferase involved in cell wall biosynthesis
VSILGALTAEKDPLGHLRVAEGVSAGCPGAVVLFVGDGPLRPAVERAARDSGGAARVLGARSDVAELLAASDLLLLASRTEGMPGCLIEAGMLGVPCVASAHPGVREIVRDGETGALVAPNEPRAAAAAVLRLLEDDGARGRMAEAARQWCRGRFDIHAVAPRYLEVYADVAGEHEGSSRTGDASAGPRRPA